MAKRKPRYDVGKLASLPRMFIQLIVLEVVICAAMLAIGHLSGNIYFQGVGVGLLIAWVTTLVAYLYKAKR